MISIYRAAITVVVIAILAGTAFAADMKGYVETVDREKGYLSLKYNKEIVEFECAPGILKKQVKKNAEVTVEYTDEAGKKKASKIKVHTGC